MSPTKQVELSVQLEHQARVMRRLQVPNDRTAMPAIVLLLILVAFALAGIVRVVVGAM